MRLCPATGIIDGKVYVPTAVLDYVDARVEEKGERRRGVQKLDVSGCNGKTFSVDAREVGDELMVPICDMAGKLGISVDWNESARTLTLQAKVDSIDFDGSDLRVSTTYPVPYRVNAWNRKLIVHLDGAVLPDGGSDRIRSTPDVKVRIGQDIVFDMTDDIRYKITSANPTSLIALAIAGRKPGSAPIVSAVEQTPAPAAFDPASTQPEPEVTEAPAPVYQPATVDGIDFRKQDSRRVELTIATSGPIRYTTAMTRDPAQFVVDIPNATLHGKFDGIEVDREIVRGIRVEQVGSNSIRVTMDLSRAVISDVRVFPETNRLLIGLEPPRGAGGSLSSKIIVIDPGHGGRQAGARACDGTYEKSTNFQIAQRVQKLLADAGACAVMTRDSDCVVGLQERVDFAKRQSANLFVSIHGNSSAVPASRSGLEFYFHRGDQSGHELANCIHDEVIRVAGLRDWGVKQDPGRIGFAVLRCSSAYCMPSALLELGFVNHPNDWSKISSPDWQQTVAEAVVRGIKTYIEGNPGTCAPVSRAIDTAPAPVVVSTQPEVKAIEPTAPPEKTEEPVAPPVEPEKHAGSTSSGPHRPGDAY